MKFEFDDVVEWFEDLWLRLFSEDRILKQATKAATQLEKRAEIQTKRADKADVKAVQVVQRAEKAAQILGAKSEVAKKDAKRATKRATKVRSFYEVDED